MRHAVTHFLRFCLRIFFRRIELLGLERVPDDGPVIFAVNHPNGLVDPLFLLCYSSRRVSFLAKAPLLHYPVIGWFVRTFEAIPVYRRQDMSGGSNSETFARARDLLQRGGSIAIFPEGTTHDDPQLRELKTGAARIALGAEVDGLVVVPTGIYYTAKHVFRSSALMLLGEPLRVQPVPVDENGEPPADRVQELTNAINERLASVTLQAESRTALELIGRAEDIFTADDRQPLAEEFDIRRQFINGYLYLKVHEPERLDRLQQKVTQFEAELRRVRIDVHELRPAIDALRLFRVLVLLPVALVGAAINYPVYRVVGLLARRFSRGESSIVATIKFVAALALYPVTYIIVAVSLVVYHGVAWGAAALALLPLVAYVALRVFEDFDDVIGDVRAVLHRLFRRYGHDALIAEREEIRQEMIAVAREMRR